MPSNQEIIMIIMLVLIFYLLFKTHSTQENFTVNDDVKQAINEIYKADINAIRNLSNFSTEIMNNNDSLTIPAKTTTVTDLTITGKITGDLNVDGNVKFNNKNSNIMEIFPSGMILAWSGSIGSIPKGWATCDGRKYKIDTTGFAIFDSNGTATPDLRSRCILGAGEYSGVTYPNDGSPAASLTVRGVGNWSGYETHTLTIDQMPNHRHNFGRDWWSGPPSNRGVDLGSGQAAVDESGETTLVGGGKPHNIMQPFYVLCYIMKL